MTRLPDKLSGRLLRRNREQFKLEGLIHAESSLPPSLVLIVAILLLCFGLVAIYSMLAGAGPFG